MLGPGDALVLYTDGLTEARSHEGLFGEERVRERLAELSGGEPAVEIIIALEELVAGHSDRRRRDDIALRRDDIALLVARVSP